MTEEDEGKVAVRQLDGGQDRAALYALRARVLRPGRPAAEAVFPGDDDPDTIHLGAFVGGGCVGVATLLRDRGVRLRGMAVAPEFQGRGVGAALVRHMQETAAGAGHGLWCDARLAAVGFYERLGWRTEGERFEIPGVGPHYVMRWTPPTAG